MGPWILFIVLASVSVSGPHVDVRHPWSPVVQELAQCKTSPFKSFRSRPFSPHLRKKLRQERYLGRTLYYLAMNDIERHVFGVAATSPSSVAIQSTRWSHAFVGRLGSTNSWKHSPILHPEKVESARARS